MNINIAFTLVLSLFVFSTDCAPKSKHYLVKVPDNANDNKLEMMPTLDLEKVAKRRILQKKKDYEDTADRD